MYRKEGTDTRLREGVGKLTQAGEAELVEITQLVTRSEQPTADAVRVNG